MILNITAIDPAIRNFGYALGVFDTSIDEINVLDIHLVTTEKDSHKTVRRNSDDLRRSQHQHRGMVKYTKTAHVAMAEIPVGSQMARGAMSNGICIGILSSCPVPLIQVSPEQVKLVSVGHKQASKEEMIEWAMSQYPHLNWLRHEKNGKGYKKGDPVAANEHLADAVATLHAGVETEEFQQSLAMYKRVV